MITDIDEELFSNFYDILQVISSVSFNEFCLKTAEKYIPLYSWYYMSPTVHKVLIHTKFLLEIQD